MSSPQFFVIIFILFIASSPVNLIDRQLACKKKLAKTKRLSCYSYIIVHFDIAKRLEIIGRISESVKLKKKDGNEKKQERKYKEVLGSSLFLVTRPSLAV